MKSLDAKKRLLAYTTGFNTPYMGGVWEVANLWNADFIAVKWDGRITEYEIKVSLADLRGEVAAIREALKPGTILKQTNMFGTRNRVRPDVKLSHTKIEKHHHYLVEHKKPDMSYEWSQVMFYPNIFYFAVPSELVAYAVDVLKGLPYGVFDLDNMKVVVKAKSLRKEGHGARTFIHLFNRSCVMRADQATSIEANRYAVLEQVAREYKLEPDSVGYMRLMAIGKQAD